MFSVCLRLLQAREDNSLNVTVPMRMLEVFSSERTYLPFLQDENYVTALIEQILCYMVQKGTELIYLVRDCTQNSLFFASALIIFFSMSFCLLGYYRSLYVLVNHKLPSSLEYSDSPSIPLAQTLLEHTLKPLHFTYSSCPPDTRYTLTYVHTVKKPG